MIFTEAKSYKTIKSYDEELKKLLNYNPNHNRYTMKQNFPDRDPNETDRGGWRGYYAVYSKYISKLKDKNLSIIEVGTHYGFGLLAWQKYFTKSTVYGVDIVINQDRVMNIQELRKKFQSFNKVKTLYFDSTKKDDWLELYGKEFDIIIDDGDHHPYSQIKTLESSWDYLKKGGFYFIEDISHRYGREELESLSSVLEQKRKEGNKIKIYSHENLGLRHILNNKQLRKRYNIGDKAEDNHNEYIVVIQKAK
jgi:hypothetical protein